MRFALTAKTLANLRAQGKEINDMTRGNVEKVTRYREDGHERLEQMVRKIGDWQRADKEEAAGDEKVREGLESVPRPRRVYPELQRSR